MNEFITYLLPILALTVLAAGWMGVQLLAQKMKTKNHIDNTSGCCGACEGKSECRRQELGLEPNSHSPVEIKKIIF